MSKIRSFAFFCAALLAGPFLLGNVTSTPSFSLVSKAWAADDDILFGAPLSDDEQSIPTTSAGSGYAEFRLERDTLKLSWKIVYKDISSAPTEIGLYGPENVGANAGMIVNLAPKGMGSPVEGSTILSDGNFQYLITTRVYVNIKTQKWKDGELRGQVRRLRSKEPTTN